jgi:hypothetical protein
VLIRNSIRRAAGLGVLGFKRALDLDRALDSVHHAGKLGEHAVARGIDESAAALLDERID